MFNLNNGYVGTSRSVRSQQAINSYEVPLSMINRQLVDGFLHENKEQFSKEDFDFLKATPIKKWKYIAKNRALFSSWHHTSSFFNETNHYDLNIIAEKLLATKNTLDDEYKKYLQSQKIENPAITYGVIKVQVWGGSKKHPKIEGYNEVAGIIVGDWLFYKENHSVLGLTCKYKTNANKVEWLKRYTSYTELTKNNSAYKNTKTVFNKLIAEKG